MAIRVECIFRNKKDGIVLSILNSIEIIKKTYYSYYGLIIQMVACGSVIYKIFSDITLYDNQNNLRSSVLVSLILSILVIIIIIIIWWVKNFRLPSIDSKYHGIVVCLDTEKYDDYVYLKTKLSRNLKYIFEEKSDLRFSIKFMPFLGSLKYYKNFVKLNANKSKGYEYSLNTKFKDNWNLIIFAKTFTGKTNNIKEIQVDTRIGIRHKKLPVEINRNLAKELSNLVDTYLIKENSDLEDVKATTLEISVIIEYAIGLAGLLSGAYSYTNEIFFEINKSVQFLKKNRKTINYIKSRINHISYINLIALIQTEIDSNIYGKMEYDLNMAISYANDIKKIDLGKVSDKGYEYYLKMAYLSVVQLNDLNEAKKYIDKCSTINPNDICWKYSNAFILMCECDYKKADNIYRRILKKKFGQIIMIEEFINKQLEMDIQKIQFYYVLGMINFINKEDFVVAHEYFLLFMNKSKNNSEYEYLIFRCKEYLDKSEFQNIEIKMAMIS